jgi:hypothetical protein
MMASVFHGLRLDNANSHQDMLVST